MSSYKNASAKAGQCRLSIRCEQQVYESPSRPTISSRHSSRRDSKGAQKTGDGRRKSQQQWAMIFLATKPPKKKRLLILFPKVPKTRLCPCSPRAYDRIFWNAIPLKKSHNINYLEKAVLSHKIGKQNAAPEYLCGSCGNKTKNFDYHFYMRNPSFPSVYRGSPTLQHSEHDCNTTFEGVYKNFPRSFSMPPHPRRILKLGMLPLCESKKTTCRPYASCPETKTPYSSLMWTSFFQTPYRQSWCCSTHCLNSSRPLNKYIHKHPLPPFSAVFSLYPSLIERQKYFRSRSRSFKTGFLAFMQAVRIPKRKSLQC